MKIEINVSKLEKKYHESELSYYHLFATAPRSITSTEELKRVLPEIRAKFPTPEYKISIHVDPEVQSYLELEGMETNEEIVNEVTYTLFPSMRPKKNKRGSK